MNKDDARRLIRKRFEMATIIGERKGKERKEKKNGK